MHAKELYCIDEIHDEGTSIPPGYTLRKASRSSRIRKRLGNEEEELERIFEGITDREMGMITQRVIDTYKNHTRDDSF